MRENGAADTKGTGNELGEMLVYTLLEEKLDAPKILSRVELSTDAVRPVTRCQAVAEHGSHGSHEHTDKSE